MLFAGLSAGASEKWHQYLVHMDDRIDQLSGRNRAVAAALLAYLRRPTLQTAATCRAMLWAEKFTLTDVFDGSEQAVLVAFLGEDLAGRFKKVWDRQIAYPYQRGWLRRSYRAPYHPALYLHRGLSDLRDLIALHAEGFSPEGYFASFESAQHWRVPVVSSLWAMEIDMGNVALKTRLHHITLGEDGPPGLMRQAIQALLKSHDTDAHRWVGDLLLAARLQEGLRQAITESMDDSSHDGFVYLLGLIVEHGLTRFSSVARAVDTWTGLTLSATDERIVTKATTAAYRCLTDPDYTTACLESDDALLIYVALWATAVVDTAATEGPLQSLIGSDRRHRRLTALIFLSESGDPRFMHHWAASLLNDADRDVAHLAVRNLLGGGAVTRTDQITALVPDQAQREALFQTLQQILDAMPKNGWTFNSAAMPWWTAALTRQDILRRLLLLTGPNATPTMLDALYERTRDMDVPVRCDFVRQYARHASPDKGRDAILTFLGDKSPQVREVAMELAQQTSFRPQDFRQVEHLLQRKSGDLRQNAIRLLLQQSPEHLLHTVERLARDPDDRKRAAVVDLIEQVEKDARFAMIRARCQAFADGSKAGLEAVYTRENGFGLYDPNQVAPALVHVSDPARAVRQIRPGKLPLAPQDAVHQFLSRLDEAVHKHRDDEYEYEGWDRVRQRTTIGAELRPFLAGKQDRLDHYPLADVWRTTVRSVGTTPLVLLTVTFLSQWAADRQTIAPASWLADLYRRLFPYTHREAQRLMQLPTHAHAISTLLPGLLRDTDPVTTFSLLLDMATQVVSTFPADKMTEPVSDTLFAIVLPFHLPPLSFWLSALKHSVYDDCSFTAFFALAYQVYRQSRYQTRTSLRFDDFERASGLGIIDDGELVQELMIRPDSAHHLQELTSRRWVAYPDRWPRIRAIAGHVIERVIDIEVTRGELPTEVSGLAGSIAEIRGARHFANVIRAAGDAPFDRTRAGDWSFGATQNSTRMDMLSHLLKACVPDPRDSATTLHTYLPHGTVTTDRLVDAAMYAPQWLDIVEAYLGWPGLALAGWYFHAHVSDFFSEEKKARIARYSSIDPEDLKDGAFDITWFREAYEALGPERFGVVYRSAKYMAGGALHRRAQRFADTVLGKVSVADCESGMGTKRDKLSVLCYGLVPVEGRTDLLHRYEVLQRFVVESRQFGAQRQASEQRAANLALANLAQNAGYHDVDRLTWAMETETLHAISRHLEPTRVEDAMMWVEVDDFGAPVLAVERGGKRLKAVPPALKNHPAATELRTVHRDLQAQYRRARVMLERAMQTEVQFPATELMALSRHPVIRGLLQHLVFQRDEDFGFVREGHLALLGGRGSVIPTDAVLHLAHPVHLHEAGVWAAFQRHLFDHQIVQPFKQVFRELYRPTADELALNTRSPRYAGHQVQQRKTLALLKARGWTVSYEEGLQKVYHRENLVVQLQAMADWFSPADIEAPTLEDVLFTHRRTGSLVAFGDISSVIFSEVMRDLDLVVSVAHVGGVDPEASQSTVEMRTALVSEMVRLLNVQNVHLKGTHAHIQGHYGEYTVHLGSGLVHKIASGAVHILPVHSQHRGRVFLPFVDDDPRTGEIISKIVLLADDKTIRDPAILEQVTR